MKRLLVVTFVLLATVAVTPILSQSITADTFAGLRARSIGPAVTSGRVSAWRPSSYRRVTMAGGVFEEASSPFQNV